VINVAFWYDRPQEYSGGLHYMKNLLFAISRAQAEPQDAKIRPYIFFGRRVDSQIVEQFASLANVVRTSVLDRRSIPWLVHRSLFKYFGCLWVVRYLMRKYSIDLVSHAEHVFGQPRSFRLISWLPDFQYLHLPELFPKLDSEAETDRLRTLMSGTDMVILSSHAAFEDYKRIATSDAAPASVLQFVSQPNWELRDDSRLSAADMEAKYRFSGKFFFLPNQFWRHKNHFVVFEAIRLLKVRGVNVTMLCTGNLLDYKYKDNSYVAGLRDFISRHDLHSQIRILGMIDYGEVLFLMRNCIAVLNPSRFEGWSSTVEEARSMGQRLILSNIPVHLEQNPPKAEYFPADSPEALAAILERLSDPQQEMVSPKDNFELRADLERRTLVYGRGYLDLIDKVVHRHGLPNRHWS
jgi:glycosyltransferase involved in cell wall biosynthesis